MNNISINISGRIDTERVSVLREINDVAKELNINFFVVGAFARDVIFEHIHRISAPRMTEDIDIGIEVASWKEFKHLTDTLIERGHFSKTNLPHRFSAGSFPTLIDIVPYGGISDENKRISWPPNHDMIMSILGFEEAYQSALNVRLSNEPPLEILVPSIPALALLKIISWDDAYPKRERDAHDLLFILEKFESTDILHKLFESHVPLLTEEEFDPQFASVRLLGREIAQLGNTETVSTVEKILARETDEDQGFRMLSHMVKGFSFQSIKFDKSLQLLKKLLQGIREVMPRA
ncbi:MAG: nucleotidyl transferase AbiEii/AbiGii toxin family protein [Chlorobiaceae bacterium]